MRRTEPWILWSFHLAHPKSMELQNPKYLSGVSWKPVERSYRLGKGSQEEVRLVTFGEHLTDLRYGNEAGNILPKSPRVKEAFIAIDLSEIYINIFIFLYSSISLLIFLSTWSVKEKCMKCLCHYCVSSVSFVLLTVLIINFNVMLFGTSRFMTIFSYYGLFPF